MNSSAVIESLTFPPFTVSANNVLTDCCDHNITNNSLAIDGQPNQSTADANFGNGVLVLSLYLMTTIVALIGNTLVCRIILTSKKARNTTYVFIANLAISDILGALTIPGQWLFCAAYFLDNYSSGERFCAITKSAQIHSYFVSTFTMTVIAIDRYRMVKNPLRPRLRPRLPLIMVWLCASAFTATTFFSSRVSDYWSAAGLIGCRVVLRIGEGLTNFLVRKIRVALLILTQYAIPLTISSVLYARIIRQIWRQTNVGEMTSAQLFQRTNSKVKTIKMLMIVVLAFAVCWLPVHVIHFVDFYVTPLFPSSCNSSLVYMLFYWFAVNSCSLNPFIYCWLNEDFRRGARAVFCCYRACISNIRTSIRYNNFRSRAGSSGSSQPTGDRSRSQSIFYISAQRKVNVLV